MRPASTERRFRRVLPAAVVAALLLGALPCQAWRSVLYPENWTPPVEASFSSDKLIQDFSYAGYRRGEEPIPHITGPVFDVTQPPFNADATGRVDATVAMQTAIDTAAKAGGGVVFLPAGTYLVAPQGDNKSALQIQDSNIVLRGAGHGQTFILNTSFTRSTVILISPRDVTFGDYVDVTADLDSPTHRLPVADASAFAVGDKVRLVWSFTQEWIDEHKQGAWWTAPDKAPTVAQYHREVTAVNPAEGWIELDVPTRYTIKTRDGARLRTMHGNLSGVGLENFSIGNVQHPGSGFGGGDYKVEGTAARDVHGSWLIAIRDTFDSWITGVHSFQAQGNTSTCHMLSNGISLFRCFRMTLADCVMRRPQYGGGGGNGYMFRIQSSQEILVENCVAEFSRHGFVVSHAGASGNVFLNCLDKETDRATGDSGPDGYVTGGAGSDHHMHFSHSNLFDSCKAEDSFYTAHHRGSVGGRVPHGLTSAHGVYWNTSGSGSRGGALVRSAQGRYGYIIGTSGPRSAVSIIGGPGHAPPDHLEGEGLGATLEPPSLYRDQLARRLESMRGPIE
jgi:hypothetical protein